MVKEVKSDRATTRKSVFVKCFIVIFVFILLILLILLINLLTTKENEMCNNEYCTKAASEILETIDQSFDPCDNFYAFACGKLIENGPIHENTTSPWNTMITEAISENDSKAFAAQKLFYQSCMDLEAIENDNQTTLFLLFHELGGWPYLKGANWSEKTSPWSDWIDFMVKAKNLGLKFNFFLEFDIQKDGLKIGIPKYLKFLGPNLNRIYRDFVIDVVSMMGAPQLVHYETQRTAEFEDELARLMDRHRDRSSGMRRMSIRDVQRQIPDINWQEFIFKITGISFNDDTYIAFDLVEYLRQLRKLLMGTPKRFQGDFMMWKIVEDLWPYLSSPIRDRFELYNQLVLKRRIIHDREHFCINESIKQFRFVAESAYLRRVANKKKRDLTNEIVDNIRKEFIRQFEKAAWLNETEKQSVMGQLNKVAVMIGGPEEMFEEQQEKLGFYSQVRNVIKLLTEQKNKYYSDFFNLLKKSNVKKSWLHYEFVTNWNSTYENSNLITIPVTLLEDDCVHPERMNYLNYATLGTFIADKLFNNLYKSNGKRVTWWSSPLLNNIAKCLLNQQQLIQFHNIKDDLTSFIATEIAYKAYQERLKWPEARLPGLNYTQNQLFWMQSSIFMCRRNYHVKELGMQITNSVINSVNFATDFQCSPTMAKCTIL